MSRKICRAAAVPPNKAHPPYRGWARKPLGLSQGMNGPLRLADFVPIRQNRASMDEHGRQTVRKTYKYKLKPTPEQEQAMAFVVRRCRELYNAGLQERQDAWQQVRA